jgi:hypothetical protein
MCVRRVTIHEDAVRWEDNRAYNERLQVRRQRRQAWSAGREGRRGRTPSPILNPREGMTKTEKKGK